MEASEDGLKILLAESTVAQPHTGLDRLRDQGHEIHRAQNGVEVLSAIDREAYDIVLMNLDQPAIGTNEVDAARQQLDSRKLPVIGVTSLPHTDRCSAAWQHCVTWTDLPDRITELSGAGPQGSSAPVINISAALECTDGDVELLQSLIELYFEQQPGLLTQIHDGVAQCNSELLERGAHSLKGCVSVFAAADTRQAAFILETIGQESNWAGAKAALENLNQQLGRFETALRDLDAAIGRGEISGR